MKNGRNVNLVSHLNGLFFTINLDVMRKERQAITYM